MPHSRKGDRHFQKMATYIIPVTCFMYRLSWSLMEQFMGMPVICKGRDQPVHQQSQHLSGELCRRATLCFPSHLLRGPLDHPESRHKTSSIAGVSTKAQASVIQVLSPGSGVIAQSGSTVPMAVCTPSPSPERSLASKTVARSSIRREHLPWGG